MTSSDPTGVEAKAPEIRKLDEKVVNRIAAGEVVQRPCSAVKEMLENSIDAGSKQVTVTLAGGGLKSIRIQDDGCGVRVDDFPILCERFTTSKLRAFEDLESIQTLGFRGEALASITHVAHVTITSRTAGSKCAYRAQFSDGEMVPAKGRAPAAPADPAVKPKPCAGNKGTLIVVEDLFYNVRTRRNAFKSDSEEYRRTLDVVSRYAIHHAGVAVTCKSQGSAAADLHTQNNFSTVDCIRHIYGASLAKELVEVSCSSTDPAFTAKGYVTSANYNLKKTTFILFINHRLVDCPTLRRALEQVYKPYLPAGTHPFIYLCLTMDGRNVDVNVHPTKSEVHFLHEERVVAAIQEAVEGKLLGGNRSRTFQTQAIITGVTARPAAAAGAGAHDGGPAGADPSDDPDSDPAAATGAPALAAAGLSAEQASVLREARRKDKAVLGRQGAMGSGAKNDLGGGRALGLALAASSAGPDGTRPGSGASGASGTSSSGTSLGTSSSGTSSGATGSSGGGIVPAYKRDRTRGGQIGQMEAYLTQSQASDPGGVDAASSRAGRRRGRNDGAGAPGAGAGEGTGGHGYGLPGNLGSKRPAESGDPLATTAGVRKRRKVPATKLTSVRDLLADTADRCHSGLAEVIQSHVFVGLADPSFALIQHETKLLLANVSVLSRELMRQLVLLQFGNLSRIRMPEPLPIHKLAMAALDDPATGWTPEDGPRADLAQVVTDLLTSRGEMLSEYFSIDITEDATGAACIASLPLLAEGHSPDFGGLPMLILRLATEVDWSAEKECFRGISAELAKFYALPDCDADESYRGPRAAKDPAPGEAGQGPSAEDPAENPAENPDGAAAAPIDLFNRQHRERIVKHVLLPEMKANLLPPEDMAGDGSFIQIASLEKLYTVFERC